jgi:flagellar biosynthesis/type III secretory pathway chaperone
MTPAERIDTLIALTDRLSDCLEQELAALRRRRLDVIAELHREKTKLTAAYEIEVKQIRQSREMLAGLELDRRQALAIASTRLSRCMIENERALRAARTVNDRVLKAVVEAVERERGQPVGYGQRGRAPTAMPRRAGSVGAVTLDQRL